MALFCWDRGLHVNFASCTFTTTTENWQVLELFQYWDFRLGIQIHKPAVYHDTLDILLDICLGLTKNFCQQQPEKPWLIPTIQMKISKDVEKTCYIFWRRKILIWVHQSTWDNEKWAKFGRVQQKTWVPKNQFLGWDFFPFLTANSL